MASGSPVIETNHSHLGSENQMRVDSPGHQHSPLWIACINVNDEETFDDSDRRWEFGCLKQMYSRADKALVLSTLLLRRISQPHPEYSTGILPWTIDDIQKAQESSAHWISLARERDCDNVATRGADVSSWIQILGALPSGMHYLVVENLLLGPVCWNPPLFNGRSTSSELQTLRLDAEHPPFEHHFPHLAHLWLCSWTTASKWNMPSLQNLYIDYFLGNDSTSGFWESDRPSQIKDALKEGMRFTAMTK